MKITVKAKALTTGLSFVSRAAARQGGTAPHLTSVLFEADRDGGLTTMRTTDAEMAASLTSTAPKVEVSGKAAVPVRTLSDLVSRVDPEKSVVLEASEAEVTLTVEGTGNHYSLRAAKTDEFPPLPKFPSQAAESFSLKATVLQEAIRRVSPAAARDEGRPVLGGLLFSFESTEDTGQADQANETGEPEEDGGAADESTVSADENASNTSAGEVSKHPTTMLNVVATDSYRMMVACDRSERIAHPPGKAIVPVRALREALKLCSLGPEYVDVALTENSAFFRVGGVMLSTRLIAGNFPEYRKLLPADKAFEHTFSVDSADLLDVLKRANLFATRQSPPAPVRLTFDAAQSVLSVSVQSEAVGSALESLPAKALTPDAAGARDGSEGFEILFNPVYLTDAVKSCADAGEGASGFGGGTVVFCMDAPHKPAVLRPQPEENDGADETSGASLRCLIMPMADPHRK